MRSIAPQKPDPRAVGGALRFGILGPLEVDAASSTIALGGRQQRAVLAMLIARANEIVSTETLVDEIWGEEPPGSARNVIQNYISHLRKALGHDRVEGGAQGYRLRLHPSELDAARFDALVGDARKAMPVDPTLAVGILGDALALWRGPALGDLADQPSLMAEATRLDEMRLQAQADRIEGLLAMGSEARAIGEAQALLAFHPLRERLWGLLVLSLYREGRQAEALDAYQRARGILADELGIAPSPELTRLHEQILRQDPALDLVGEPLRGYRLLEEVGEGSTGTVFRAIQPHVGRDVAVKIVREPIAADPVFVRTFEPRAHAAASLEHPHIVPVYDYWREPGRAYVVSRYLRGGSLRALLDRGEELDRERTVHVLDQVASALAFAHRQGVAHGDVTPANVLFDEEDNAYLTDFVHGVGAVDAGNDVRELTALARRLLPGDRSIAELTERLELGTEALAADAFVEALRTTPGLHPTVASVRDEARNPYKGLRAFSESDARDFFGRGALIKRLIGRLHETEPGSRFLAIVGPSGGGKSSVVQAGLVPAIRRGALIDAPDPSVVAMFPGAHPIAELESALLRIAVTPVTRLGERLESGSRGLLDAVDLVVPAGAEVVLIVDQLEEVFTLTATDAERELFLESLRVAAVDPSSRLRVIVTLRADFYDRPLLYPRVGELLSARTSTISPLTPDELEQAIRRPAEQVGVSVEPGLVAEAVGDVAHQPGALPLLQYALTELFERRDGEQLTLAAYHDMGGVAGALSTRAERIFGSHDRAGRRATKQVLLRLVTLGEGRQDTRRRVTRRELDSLEVDLDAVEAVLGAFGRHRLLTFDREPSTREPTVEIAHEALLTVWSRLSGWIDDARDDLRQLRRLAQAAAEWRGSGRETSFLLVGTRLEQIASWAASTELAIGHPERAYLKTSIDERERGSANEHARREREAQLERRSVRRLRGLVAVLAAAVVAAASLTGIAVDQREKARREASIARARELVVASGAFLETDPDRSILLAMEAVELTRSVDGSVLLEAEETLHKALVGSRAVLTVPGIGGALSWSPNGVFVTEGPEDSGMIEIRDDVTGEPIRAFRGHDGDVTDVEFSTDGSLLATAGDDGQLKVWDPASGDLVSGIAGTGRAEGISFSADGTRVAAVWPDEKVVRVSDPLTGDLDRELSVPMLYEYGTALSPDGSHIAFAGGGPLVVFDLGTDARAVLAEPDWGAGAPSWSPDGNYLTVVGEWGVWLLDATSGELRDRVQGVGGSVAWSPDSRRFVAAQADDVVVLSILEGGVLERTLTLSGGEMGGTPRGLAFSSDGRALMAGGEGMSAVKIWSLEPRNAEWASIRTEHNVWSDAEFMPDGEHVAANSGGWGASVRIWDIGSARLVRMIGEDGQAGGHFREPLFDVSPDGGSVAIQAGGSMRVLDTSTGEEIVALRRAGVVAADWSPDGDLLVAAGADGSVSILDRSGRLVQILETGWERVFDVRFDPDGHLVAISNDIGDPLGDQTWIWDWEREDVITEIADNAYEIAWDPTGSRIITDGTVWDVRSGERLFALPEGIRFAFSPDGSRIVRAGTEGVDLFDARTGERLFVLQDDCPTAGVDFSPDGQRLVTVDTCDTVRVWAYGIDDLLDLARQRVTRSLTAEECRVYLHVEPCPA